MITESSGAKRSTLEQLPIIGSICVIGLGLAVLAGWVFDIDPLKSIVPSWAFMAPNTAVMLILIGLVFIILESKQTTKWSVHLALVILWLTLFVELLTLSEYVFGWNLGFDALLFHNAVVSYGAAHPGRMALPTVVGLFLLTSELLQLRSNIPWRIGIAICFAFGSCLFFGLQLLIYIYDSSLLRLSSTYNQVALHTAIAVEILSVSILLMRSSRRIIHSFLGDGLGNAMVRRVLPVAIVIPIIAGWIGFQAESAEVNNSILVVALGVTLTAGCHIILSIISARLLNQLEVALKHSEERYRLIVETAQEGIVLLNADARIIFVNKGLCDIFGYTSGEMINKPIVAFMDDEAKAIIIQALQRRWNNIVERYELKLQHKNGNYRCMSVASSPTHDENGQFTGVVAMISDITERKLAEQSLRKNEARLRAIFENSADAILVAKDDLQIVGNPAYLSLFGYKHDDEYVGKPIFDIIVENERPRIMDIARLRTQQETAPAAYETRGRKQDGSEFDVEVHVSTYELDGETYTIANGRDVTQRKTIGEALRVSEERFRTTFEQAAVGIAHVSPDGHFLSINQKFCDLLGYTSNEVLSKSFQEITHPDDLDGDLEHRRQLLTHKIDTYSVEKRYYRKDQTIQWVQLTASICWNTNGLPKYFIAVVEDIAERKRAEDELLRLNRTLSVLSDVNQAIVRIRPATQLFDHVCNIAVDVGGFRMAWLGLVDPATQQVKPVASSGVTGNYFEALNMTLLEGPQGYGLTANTLCSGNHTISQNIEHDPRMAPWRENALRLGYRASAAFPLKINGHVRGVLNLYATQANFFNDHEVRLLEEMADDISFAMEYAEQEQQRKQAERKLQEAERFAHATVDALSAHIAILDEHGTILSVNEAWSRFARQNNAVMNRSGVGTNYLNILEAVRPESEAQAVLKGINQVMKGETDTFSLEYPCHSPDEQRWFVVRVTRFEGDGPTRIVMAHENVTERVLVSELLAKEKAQLTERVKELNCLYSQSKLMEQPEISLDGLFQETVDLMPPAWLYPNIACARLTIEGRIYTSHQFKETSWRQASSIVVEQKQIGYLELYYLEERPAQFEGPFLKEERFLIDELALRLGHKIETVRAEQALRQAYDTLEVKVEERTAELLEAKERVEAILNNSVDGILLTDREFNIQQTNTAFDQLFACTPDAYFNQSLTNLFSGNDDDLILNTVRRCLSEEEDSYITVLARRSDGTVFDAEISIGYFDGEGVIGVIRDITERKQAQKALEKHNLTLTTLHMGALEIATELEIPVLLTRIVKRAVELLNADRGGGIYLFDSQNDVLRLEAVSGINEGRRGITLRPDEGVAGRILQTGQPLIVNDYTHWEGSATILVVDPPSAVMGIPLVIHDKVIGALVVIANAQEKTFTPDDKSLAEMFATQAAVAMHNAQLYSAAQREIAERKLVEDALRQSEATHRLLADNMADVVWVMDLNTKRFIYVSPSVEQLRGYTPQEVLAQSMEEVVTPASFARVKATIPQQLEAYRSNNRAWKPNHSEIEQTCKDGSNVWTEVVGKIINDGTDNLKLLGVSRDITERRRAEESLRQSEEKFRLLLDGAPVATVISDRTGQISLVNKQAEALLGYHRSELVGQMIEILVPDYANQKHVHNRASYVATPRLRPMGIGMELFAKHKDGHAIPVEIELSYLETQDDMFIMSFIMDVTERKQIETSLRQALASEKELGELKTRFVSTASHEFRTPLATILALTETLTAYRHKLPDEQIDQRLNKIKTQVGHLKDIMEDVLMLARMQARRVDFKPALVDLDALCRGVLSEFESRPDIKHRISYQANGETRQTMIDEKLMRQVISNLMSNAIKYSPEDKAIQVSLDRSNETCVLAVRDQGIGIPEDDVKHLFEPFHRASNVGTISGTGLGLVITKEAVELHGGTIKVESQEGIGTTFTICIPAIIKGDNQK